MSETENQNETSEMKDKIIKGKNKTYVISSTLGKGTFGKVKLVHNIDDENEKYACKVLLKENIKDEDDYLRCKREMKIISQMMHPNVVRTFDIISTETTYFIFMEYCSRGELFNYIVKEHHLSEEKSAFFYYQLINGIDYIHKKGICHRDLKPENLLLTDTMILKIIDFGLSNYFNGSLLETPCGSPCYASPEMVMGNNYNGFCIDIWSSGIILYAMLCGYLPFEEGENDEYNEELFKNIVECNVEYPPEYISPLAKDLLNKILIKKPEKRITIEDIKKHTFYKMGEYLFKQTFYSESIDSLSINEDRNIDMQNSGEIEELSIELKKYNCINDKEKSLYEDDKNSSNENNKSIAKEDNSKNLDDNILDTAHPNQAQIKEEKREIKEGNLKEEKKEQENINNGKEKVEKDEKKETIEKISNSLSDLEIKEKKNKNEPLTLSSKKETKVIGKGNNDIYNKLIKMKNAEDNIIKKIKERITSIKNDLNTQDIFAEKNLKTEGEENPNVYEKSSQLVSSDKLIDVKTTSPIPSIKHQKIIDASSAQKISLKNTCEGSIKLNACQNYMNSIVKKENCKNEQRKSVNKTLNPQLYINNQYMRTENVFTNSKRKNNNFQSLHCKLLNGKFIDNINKFNQIMKTLKSNKNKNKNKLQSNDANMINKKLYVGNTTSIKRKFYSHSPKLNVVKNNKNDGDILFDRQTKPSRQINLLTSHNIKNNGMNTNNIFQNLNFLRYSNKEGNKSITHKQNQNLNQKFFVSKDGLYKMTNINNSINSHNGITNINNQSKKKQSKHNNNNYTMREKIKAFSPQANKIANLKYCGDYCLTSNLGKKEHPKIEARFSGIIDNNSSKRTVHHMKGYSFNMLSQKMNDSIKQPFSLNSHLATNTEINSKKNINIISNKRNENKSQNKAPQYCDKINNKNKKKSVEPHHATAPYRLNTEENQSKNKNIDNNIIINFNILKPNIILDHHQKGSRKNKMNLKLAQYNMNLNCNNKSNNNINTTSIKMEHHMTESNYNYNFNNNRCNNQFSSLNKSKNNYRNFDANQIKKSKEIAQIIKSIRQEIQTQKIHQTNSIKKKGISDLQGIKSK